jgi:GMP synthase (glutamine-hydrolysing)
MAWQLKGKVAECDHREYGFAQIHVEKIGNGADILFEGLGEELEVRREDCDDAELRRLT